MGFFVKPVLDISQRLDTPDVCGLSKFISAADIQQLVELIRPGDNIGFVWVSSVTPDVATYPELKNFIWIDLSTGAFPYAMRVFNWTMNSWDVLRQADGTVSGEVLADRSIKVTKLLPASGTAGKVIVVNSDSTQFVYVFAKDAIADKTLELNKIKVPEGTAEQSYLMHTANGVLAFAQMTASQINSLIADGSLTLTKLQVPANSKTGDMIRVASGTPQKFEIFTPTPGAAGPFIPTPITSDVPKILEVEMAGKYKLVDFDTKLTGLHPGLGAYKMMVTPTPITIPTSGGEHSFAHGLPKVPTFLRAVMVCQTLHGPAAATPTATGPTWTVGMEIDISAVMDDPGRPVLYVYADASKIYLSRISASSINMPIGPNYAPTQINTANWKVKFYAGVLI